MWFVTYDDLVDLHHSISDDGDDIHGLYFVSGFPRVISLTVLYLCQRMKPLSWKCVSFLRFELFFIFCLNICGRKVLDYWVGWMEMRWRNIVCYDKKAIKHESIAYQTCAVKNMLTTWQHEYWKEPLQLSCRWNGIACDLQKHHQYNMTSPCQEHTGKSFIYCLCVVELITIFMCWLVCGFWLGSLVVRR